MFDNQDQIWLQLWCLLLMSSLSEVPTSHPEGLLCSRASSNSDKWSGARRPRRNRRAGAPSETPGWPGWGGSSLNYSQKQTFDFGNRSVAKLNHFRMLREILLTFVPHTHWVLLKVYSEYILVKMLGLLCGVLTQGKLNIWKHMVEKSLASWGTQGILAYSILLTTYCCSIVKYNADCIPYNTRWYFQECMFGLGMKDTNCITGKLVWYADSIPVSYTHLRAHET